MDRPLFLAWGCNRILCVPEHILADLHSARSDPGVHVWRERDRGAGLWLECRLIPADSGTHVGPKRESGVRPTGAARGAARPRWSRSARDAVRRRLDPGRSGLGGQQDSGVHLRPRNRPSVRNAHGIDDGNGRTVLGDQRQVLRRARTAQDLTPFPPFPPLGCLPLRRVRLDPWTTLLGPRSATYNGRLESISWETPTTSSVTYSTAQV